MQQRVKELHKKSVVMDGHNHIMIEVVKRRNMAQRAVISSVYVPLICQGGVKVLMMVVGGDSTSLTDQSDLPLWGTLGVIDMLWQEAQECEEDIAICRSASEIDAALAVGKIVIIMGLEGGRPLEGKPSMDTLSTLRSFYRLGLRHIQLVDMGRNRLGDGTGTARTNGRLTPFGLDVVKECNCLGIVVDVAHLNDPGFWDVMESSRDPVVDSHSNVRAVSHFPRNITDERIRAMAQNGGVIALSCYDKLVAIEKVQAGERPTIQDLVRHIDHIAGLVGIDHVGIGPDHFEDHGFSPAPGWMEGVYVGARDHYHVEGLEHITQFPLLTQALVEHNYSNEEIAKVLGENLLRVYRQVLG